MRNPIPLAKGRHSVQRHPARRHLARRRPARRLLAATGLVAACTAAAAGLAAAGPTAPAAAQPVLPVGYSFAAGFAAGLAFPQAAPPGANNFGCRPGSAHPYPVVLVHGTFENGNDNWRAGAPLLANHGYCVFTFSYGGLLPSDPVQATGAIAAGARQLAGFVGKVLAATGATKVDLVGHSQGGMMPRYYIRFLGGAAHVAKLVALAPSNYGTTVDGLATLSGTLGPLSPLDLVFAVGCRACAQQEQGSAFLARLNARPTVPGIRYTVIESTGDEVVTPYTNAFLPAAPNVTDIVLQQQCARDHSDHLEISYDPVALADVLNALDPAHPVRVPCLTVLPVTGPAGPVPSF
ncbi:MAG TPA: alpha/beta fold hydrolase [Streptosporangiaceae bacterium]|nr:alpha/beta fold hydrolase [Streptosporangiaceae bacterium]